MWRGVWESQAYVIPEVSLASRDCAAWFCDSLHGTGAQRSSLDGTWEQDSLGSWFRCHRLSVCISYTGAGLPQGQSLSYSRGCAQRGLCTVFRPSAHLSCLFLRPTNFQPQPQEWPWLSNDRAVSPKSRLQNAISLVHTWLNYLLSQSIVLI